MGFVTPSLDVTRLHTGDDDDDQMVRVYSSAQGVAVALGRLDNSNSTASQCICRGPFFAGIGGQLFCLMRNTCPLPNVRDKRPRSCERNTDHFPHFSKVQSSAATHSHVNGSLPSPKLERGFSDHCVVESSV